ncbi:MAG TPA: PadR family transcriptional regulator [Actinomycetota bacterium]|nr:PadR family transcriptional regulator [Actinomycetota bacterium]
MPSRGNSRPPAGLFGVLGLLAVRPMSTYELATHFDRSLGRMWPRTRSKLFEMPKRLVEMGFARAAKGATGRRAKTVYTITPKGRRALAAWLAEPGGGPVIEFEALMKVFYGDQGGRDAMIANLEAAKDWAREQIDEHIEVARTYLEGRGAFQDRAAINQITGRFHVELALTVHRWATRSLATVRTWPADPREAEMSRAALEDVLRELEVARE